jgi:hypothetical protein
VSEAIGLGSGHPRREIRLVRVARPVDIRSDMHILSNPSLILDFPLLFRECPAIRAVAMNTCHYYRLYIADHLLVSSPT